ncbi:hypothetical protein FQR65_LT00188 [Abscondita terminalis]|nr:hypothetical protein FQR65_LT00188 [Abscondita terminalis]
MGDLDELLVTSCKTSLQLWRGLNSSSMNNVHSYRVRGCIANSSLNIIGNDYIMVAEENKSLLHYWPISAMDEITKPRMVLPEPVRAVYVSPDNCYLACGINKTLYVWQICSGALLALQEIHLRPITCMRFSINSDYLIVGAENETLQVQKDHSQTKPLHKMFDHTGEVTNIQISPFSHQARFATSSLDNTCRIYQLSSGQLLLQLVWTEGISTFTTDTSFWNLFFGGCIGSLEQFSLTEPPKTTIHHVNDSENKLNFIGHTERITCLVLNITNEILVSGSEDKTVIVWNVDTRQMLKRLEHKSFVTNVGFIFENILEERKPKFVLNELQNIICTNNQMIKASAVQDDDIAFSDDSDCDVVSKVSNDDGEDKLLMAYNVNEQLYTQLVGMLSERDRL